MNIIIVIAGITIFISLLLSLFLFTVRSQDTLSNRLFAFFLIVVAVDTSGIIFDFYATKPTNLGMFRSLITFLQIPLFYLYIRSMCYSDFKLRWKHLLHAIPFVLVNLLLIPRYFSKDLESKLVFLRNNSDMLEIQFNHLLIHLQLVVYIVAIFLLLRKAKKLYKQNFTGANILSYNWLFQLTFAMTIFYSIVLLKNIFKFSQYPEISDWLKVSLFVVELIIICWYLFKALNNPTLFRNLDSSLIDSQIKSKESEHDINIESNETLSKLQSYMEQEKPFLNPYLTIKNISEEVHIPVRELSTLLNRELGQHFFDFVNQYRIENAKELLKNTSKSKLTVLEILYSVGFNSKSSFNSAFKKHTGTTPTKYRKSLQVNSL